MEKKPIIEIENHNTTTRVRLLGLDISETLMMVDYSSDGNIVLSIDTSKLTETLCEITGEDIEKARSILAPYKEDRAHFKEIIS